MPAKAPIYLKPNSGKNGNGAGRGGKKLRELLTAEMISLPLSDFRHLAHVGRSGTDDMFGDTTFLQSKTTDGQHGSEGYSTLPNLRRRAKASKRGRNNSVGGGHTEDVKSCGNSPSSGYGLLDSPILQSAFSLPALNQQSKSTPASPSTFQQGNEASKLQKSNNKLVNGISTSHETGINRITAPNGHANGGSLKPHKVPNDEGVEANGHAVSAVKTDEAEVKQTQEALTDVYPNDSTSADDAWSLDLDLGTSLMDDVMGIMDKIDL